MKNRKKKYHVRCGTQVKIEKDKSLRKKYGRYYCPYCDENLFSFEIIKHKTR